LLKVALNTINQTLSVYTCTQERIQLICVKDC
jgi:hypothetical protein